MYRSILVAIDLGDSSRQALAEAAQLAAVVGAQLTLLSVVAPLPPYAMAAGVDVAALERDALVQTQRTVDEGLASVPAGVPTRGVVRSGHAGAEIAAQIEEGGHDLVVLGSRGRGRVTSGLLGSVVGDVHFTTRISMLVVHPEAPSD
jgi:nucleotide-binding universal stress UspA family protein